MGRLKRGPGRWLRGVSLLQIGLGLALVLNQRHFAPNSTNSFAGVSVVRAQVRVQRAAGPEKGSEAGAWEAMSQSAAELMEDTSEFFVETLKAAFADRDGEETAENESAIAAVAAVKRSLDDLPEQTLATLQEVAMNQSESVSYLLDQAKSLSVKPSEFVEALGLVGRSSAEVEDKVADVLGGALPNGQEAKERIPSPYGLAVDDSAARTGADGWVVPIRAWIYRRNEQRHRIRMALARKIMMEMIHGIKNISKEGVRRYEERGRLIFRTLAFRGGERNVVLSVKFDGEDEWRDLPPTNGNGRVEVDVTVPEHLVESMASETGLLNFTVRLPAKSPGEEVTARGSSLLVQPEGVMVISDIDDTVKVTEVFLGKDVVVRNTFLEEFRPVSGMVNLYQSWWEEYGATFAFVSNSPPELQEPLREFLINSGFPLAPVFLRPLGGSKEERANFKQSTISELLRQFPRKQVVLVGDSGERDPIVCAELLRQHPVQVRKVLIRQVSPKSLVDEAIFAGIPADRWQVFTDPADAVLPDDLRDLAKWSGIVSYAKSLGSKALQEAASVLPDTDAVEEDSREVTA